jgi:hypothetical protein
MPGCPQLLHQWPANGAGCAGDEYACAHLVPTLGIPPYQSGSGHLRAVQLFFDGFVEFGTRPSS